MRKIVGTLLAAFFFVAMSCSVTFAFPKEHQVWDQWKNHDKRYNQYRYVERHDTHERAVVRYRHTEAFRWYGNHNFTNLRVYYSERDRDRAVRFSYESHEGHRVIEALRHEHGQYNHHKRYWSGGHLFNAFYWIGDGTIIRAIVSEDGFVKISVWQRSEWERYDRDIENDHNHGREN